MNNDGLRRHVKSMFAIAELERMPRELETTYAEAEDTFDELIRRERKEAWDEGFRAGWDRGHYESGNETNPYQESK